MTGLNDKNYCDLAKFEARTGFPSKALRSTLEELGAKEITESAVENEQELKTIVMRIEYPDGTPHLDYRGEIPVNGDSSKAMFHIYEEMRNGIPYFYTHNTDSKLDGKIEN